MRRVSFLQGAVETNWQRVQRARGPKHLHFSTGYSATHQCLSLAPRLIQTERRVLLKLHRSQQMEGKTEKEREREREGGREGETEEQERGIKQMCTLNKP